MFVRNLLRPGDYCIPVPLGMPITLRYGDNGVLDKVFSDYDKDRAPLNDDVYHTLIDNHIVPTSVSIQGGTTWVEGVLTADLRFSGEGTLPECIESNLLENLLTNPKAFTFRGVHASSNATQFIGYVAIRRWLEMSKFKTVMGFIVPADLNADNLNYLLKKTLSVQNPIVTHYVIYRNKETLFERTNIKQMSIKSVQKYVDENGYIHCKLNHPNGHQNCDYIVAVQLDIQKGDIVVTDQHNNILTNIVDDSKKNRKPTSNKLKCSMCGALISIQVGRETCCPDVHCVSRLWPKLLRFCSTLNILTPNYKDFKTWVSNKEVTRCADLLEIEPWSTMKIQVTLATVLDALVSPEDVANRSVIGKFVSNINNSTESLIYYSNHPDRISDALDFSGQFEDKLVKWFQDTQNGLELLAVIDSPCIELVNTNQKFEGAPIFRNTTIMITGAFAHGDLDEVEAILSSYDAKVVRKFDNSVKIIVVGDNNDGVDGMALRHAKKQGVPIATESQFFARYEIDEDLVENL